MIIKKLEELTKKRLLKKPAFSTISVGDVLLLEAKVVKTAKATSDGENDIKFELEYNIEYPSTVSVEYKHCKVLAKVDKINIFVQARNWLSKKTGVTDDEELDELIESFGGRDKLVDALRQSMINDLAKSDGSYASLTTSNTPQE